MEKPNTKKEAGPQTKTEKTGSSGTLKVPKLVASDMTENRTSSFTPETAPALVQMLVELMLSSAKMVQIAGTTYQRAEHALLCSEEALSQARVTMVTSSQVLVNAQTMAQRLLKLTPYLDFKEAFSCIPQLPVDYGTFQRLLNASATLLSTTSQGTQSEQKPLTTAKGHHQCLVCHSSSPVTKVGESAPRPGLTSPSQKGTTHNMNSVEADDENTDEEEGRSRKELQGRTSSHHKQVDVVRKEEHMGGAYVVQRRRSPRRSPSAGVDGLSPLVSETELSTIKPVSRSPSLQGSTKYMNKVIRHDRSRENSDSDSERMEDALEGFS